MPGSTIRLQTTEERISDFKKTSQKKASKLKHKEKKDRK